LKAILSDVHSNLEALQAVLDDAASQAVEAIYCLGDVIGYGPYPCECLDAAMRWSVVLLGNHEQGVMLSPSSFNPTAQRAALWTRAQLNEHAAGPEATGRRWSFLGARPLKHQEGDLLFVHASPRNPLNEYVLPGHIHDTAMMAELFALVERTCFQGHTHIPGVFSQSQGFGYPNGPDAVYRLGTDKTLINVGSVGQPRDGDWRACYALFDGESVRFRRVVYDVEATVKKINAVEALDTVLGNRLRTGR
jgi:diadenosine tetraphosphatase ApaH/serine/threonine PP2A family protein phosphatase